jgi:hypothetical protein
LSARLEVKGPRSHPALASSKDYTIPGSLRQT